MALVLVSTPGASNANSYEEVAEADEYFDARLPLATPWGESDVDKEILLVMGTRSLDAMFRGTRVLVPASGSTAAYYLVRRAWTGQPSTTTQRLAWPRTGMFDGNGNAIDPAVIPTELKEALAEYAGQLSLKDRTLDNAVAVGGIKSVSAGSVSVSFRDGAILPQVIPEAVLNLLPPSWYTEELIEAVAAFDFEVM